STRLSRGSRCLDGVALAAWPGRATGRPGGHQDALAIANRERPGRDDARTFGQAAGNLDAIVVGDAGLHFPKPRHVVLDHVDAAAPLDVDNGRASDGQRVGPSFGRQSHAGIHAGLQTEARIGYFDLHGRRARRGIEHGRHAADVAGELFAGERIDFDTRLRASLHAAEILLDEIGDHAYYADVDHREHNGVAAGERAGVEVAAADE